MSKTGIKCLLFSFQTLLDVINILFFAQPSLYGWAFFYLFSVKSWERAVLARNHEPDSASVCDSVLGSSLGPTIQIIHFVAQSSDWHLVGERAGGQSARIALVETNEAWKACKVPHKSDVWFPVTANFRVWLPLISWGICLLQGKNHSVFCAFWWTGSLQLSITCWRMWGILKCF